MLTTVQPVPMVANCASLEYHPPLLDSKGKELVLDCTDLEYISSSGLRVLPSILKQAKSVGSRVVRKVHGGP